MFSANLLRMRKVLRLTQEDVAEKVGVTRQAVAKWEAGDSLPDLETGLRLARALGVSLDELMSYEPAESMGLPLPPKGKHFFGVVTIGEKGQIVIPAKARKIFGLEPGSQLVVLGDESQGLAIIKPEHILGFAEAVRTQSGSLGPDQRPPAPEDLLPPG